MGSSTPIKSTSPVTRSNRCVGRGPSEPRRGCFRPPACGREGHEVADGANGDSLRIPQAHSGSLAPCRRTARERALRSSLPPRETAIEARGPAPLRSEAEQRRAPAEVGGLETATRQPGDHDHLEACDGRTEPRHQRERAEGGEARERRGPERPGHGTTDEWTVFRSALAVGIGH